MAESVDCSEFCRLCLVKEQVNTPIFEEIGELQQLHVKITACLPIKVTYEDSLPKRICDDCIYKLDQQYQFWNTSVNAEKQLKQWLGICDEPPPKQETEKKVKKEKEQEAATTKRPRRNARRKAAQNVRQAAAAAIAASDSDVGLPGDDMDIEPPYTKEENDSDNDDLHDNTESLEDSSYMNVGLDSEEQAEAGPSGLQKGGTVASTNSGSDNGGAGILKYEMCTEEVFIKCNDTEVVTENLKISKDVLTTNKKPRLKKQTNSQLPKENRSKCQKCKTDCLAEQTVETENGKIYRCNVCSKKFTVEKLWHKHYHIFHLLSKDFVCQICAKGFRYKYLLANHLETHKSSEQRLHFQCEHCNKKFQNKGGLRLHVVRFHLKHTGQHVCEVCNLHFATPGAIRDHAIRFHSDIRFTCDICEKVYTSARYLSLHKRLHNPAFINQKFGCEICDNVYKSQSALKLHQQKHNEPDRFTCETCGKRFFNLCLLNEHIKVHSGEKPFECILCTKLFRTKGLLKSHTRSHTGDKPFSCNICRKSFTQRTSLTVHLRYHTGERPYSCKLCDEAFVSRTFLNTHINKNHDIIT